MKNCLYGLAFLILLTPSFLLATEPPAIFDRKARFHPVPSNTGMVVSQDAIASRVGADILSAGGNAIDAAVATGFALAVTLPQAGNLGGGGFMLIHLANSERTLAVDYRETAPSAAHNRLFLDENGEVDTQQARFSHRSAGVPGTVAGLIHVLETYGSMSLQQVMAPAIELAGQGFTVSDSLAYSLNRARSRLGLDPSSIKYFSRQDGSPLRTGDCWQQSDLANTLAMIATQGTNGFYEGVVADQIVAEMARGGGLITHEDLRNYSVLERIPVQGSYRGYQVVSMPPPSSGGVHLIQMLNILEGWDLPLLGHNSSHYLHRLIETMRLAYADRSKYLGDPDYFPVPVSALIDKKYAAQLRQKVDLVKATRSIDVGPSLSLKEESPETTHFSVWDNEGNVVSNTYTLNFSYGSGMSVDGAGFLLNNEMDDFSAKPGEPNAYGLIGGTANAIEAGKRPLSSMTPTIVFKGGKPVMATGSPGGSTIITVVLQNILNSIDFGMNIAEATAAPRIHHQWHPDTVKIESGVSPDTIHLLQQLGHKIDPRPAVLGRVQAIHSENHYLYGVTDSRWPGGLAAPAKLMLKQ